MTITRTAPGLPNGLGLMRQGRDYAWHVAVAGTSGSTVVTACGAPRGAEYVLADKPRPVGPRCKTCERWYEVAK